MDTLGQFGRQLRELYNSGRYKDTVALFKAGRQGYSRDALSGNADIVRTMLGAFRRLDELQYAYTFLRYFQVKINDRVQHSLLNAYAWLLYSTLSKEFRNPASVNLTKDNTLTVDMLDEDGAPGKNKLADLIDAVRKVLPLLPVSPFCDAVYSSLTILLLKFAKQCMTADWHFINKLCDNTNIARLATECRTAELTVKGKSKLVELASDLEYWYVFKSVATEKTGQYEECTSVSTEALSVLKSFHYGNEIWFARRIAHSKKNLGRIDEAIMDFRSILKKKNDWFLWKELAELYKMQNDSKQAFDCAVKAAAQHGDIQYKIDLIVLIGDLLYEKDQSDKAFQHYELARLIRIRNDWPIPQSLKDKLQKMESGRQNSDFNSLLQCLTTYWHSFGRIQSSVSELIKGKVVHILHQNDKGTDGFIQYGQKKQVYFRLNPENKLATTISIGQTLFFTIKIQHNNKELATIKRLE